MGLLSYFKRQHETATEAPAAAAPDAVAAARTRARRRLIGATVLLGLGVIGFPLLFETQPRPIQVNIPIEIPRKDGAPPLALPPATAPVSSPSAQDSAPGAGPASPANPVVARAAAATEITERAGDQGREVPAPAAQAKPASVPRPAAPVATPAAPKPAAPSTKVAAEKPADKPVPARPADNPPAAKPVAGDGARARALLDGQAASAAASRMVVQVGAFADAGKLADARHKLEKLGLKTYTQVVTADGAKRTRVRVGPFATKADADKAAARIKAAGLPAAILTL